MPAGRLKEEDLNAMLAMGSVPEVLDALKKYEMAIPDEVRSSYDKEALLSSLEDYLDRLYYQGILGTVDVRKKPEQRLMTYVKMEIDATNLLTLLKLKIEGMSPDKIIWLRHTRWGDAEREGVRTIGRLGERRGGFDRAGQILLL